MSAPLPAIDIATFLALDVRAGVVLSAEAFPEARDPAIKLTIDFGDRVGVLGSSAKLTRRYDPDDLVGTTVLALVNLPPLRVAGFRSECLVLGVVNPDDPGDVVLVRPDPGEEAGTKGWKLA